MVFTVTNFYTCYAVYALCIGLLVYAVWKLTEIALRPYRSSLRDLPGPPSTSWVYGNLKELRTVYVRPVDVLESWVARYGKTIKVKGWFGTDRLFTMDTRALNHILSHSHDYPKPDRDGKFLGRIFGTRGLLIVEGEHHRKQRRILNPAFGPAQIRALTEVFVNEATLLRDLWKSDIGRNGGDVARIDVHNGLNRATLDVIGLAGFNYRFNALNPNEKSNELNEAFATMFEALGGSGVSIYRVARSIIPMLQLIPEPISQRIEAAQHVMQRIGTQLIAEKKAAIRAEGKGFAAEKEVSGIHNRDLLTLLIKANMSTDVPENQRLPDEDVLAQVPTFLVAGHETTSNATAWCLFALAQYPDVQQKLREELLGVPTENPTMDDLNSLPYLEAVVRETMRVHAPVAGTIRVAGKNDTIPLGKPYTDVHGQVHDTIRIDEGTQIFVPIQAINRDKSLWGEDAADFKPERWLSDLPEAVQTIPGVWSNMMSFLGGPRSCIGFRFSLVEMKALIFILLREFEYELAIDPKDIIKVSSIVQRPHLRNEMEKGTQLPLLVRPYKQA